MPTTTLKSPRILQTPFGEEDTSEAGAYTLLESTLSAYGRGTKSIFATRPVKQLLINATESIPADWKRLLNEFIADRSLLHVIFLSYESGYEMHFGPEPDNRRISGGSRVPKIIALSYDKFEVTDTANTDSNDFTAGATDLSPFDYAIPRQEPDFQRYLSDVQKIKHHIHEGDIYQANYTTSWRFDSSASPQEVYNRLRKLNPAQYSAIARLGECTVISSSPERLFRVKGNRIVTNPIKGTIRHDGSIDSRITATEELLNSVKDRAELLMIVDLLRNDLGRICKYGTVKTPALFSVEEYALLMHLVAEVTGELRDDVTFADIISSLFPGGSITGAPKRRAMQLLYEIENRPRGIYTGSFGYVLGDTMEFNIAIRTMTEFRGQYEIQAGGGIVADSDPEAEFDEAKLKARNLVRALDPSLKF